jgi:predicted aldo/keto reductase-like oxidoreductase
MHMLTDVAAWNKLKALGIEQWIEEKKAAGQIRQIGFSFHGNTDMFLQILNAYDWDFCQIQYNYMDEHSQAGRKGLEAAEKKKIPVIIMEPLRGGRLVNLLPEGARRVFSEDAHHWSPAEWGLRWLYDQSAVTCVLSGMNSLKMLEENVRIASEADVHSLTEKDFTVLDMAIAEINRTLKVPCTGCAYCMPCPHNVDIPGAFRCWNEMYAESKKSGREDYLRASICRHTPTSASLCVKCGRCEKHCPQEIRIRDMLRAAAKDLETPLYKTEGFFIRLLHMW